MQSTKNILYSLDQFKHLQQEHCTLLCILIERSFSIQKIVFFVSSGDQIKGAFTKYGEKSLTIYVPTFFNTFYIINVSSTKGQLISKKIVKPRILPKNERMNSCLLVCDVFSFVFWENPRPEKNVSKVTDL